MSVSYTWVTWNRQKRIYDSVILLGVLTYLAVFVAVGRLVFRPPGDFTYEALAIRGLGTCALLMLHIALWIGPLARLDSRLLPLLYNRRHLGVTTFLVALSHATLSTAYYHGFGNLNPVLSLLTANTNYMSLSRFPFETLGIIALLVLFLMASTSHDFWLKNLTPRWWKWLHMLAYVAYGLLIMHVIFGALQSERSSVLAGLLIAGLVLTVTLHLRAGLRELVRDRTPSGPLEDGFVDVGSVDDIPNNCGKVVCLPGRERIAVFRYSGQFSAVSNACEHQGGPLGEGKVIDGCITCPWHGYQYQPQDGRSPPPFTEKIATYEVRLRGRRVLVNPEPKPKGTPVEPARVKEMGRE
jgi:DMSO/TMAO reductase YedYZ heme-binding membrane subunit/nitrite reductase/ring-hydroxylating ferredoxin subunit